MWDSLTIWHTLFYIYLKSLAFNAKESCSIFIHVPLFTAAHQFICLSSNVDGGGPNIRHTGLHMVAWRRHHLQSWPWQKPQNLPLISAMVDI